jgi:glycosyltransferase involved in cell wall biosynthesis
MPNNYKIYNVILDASSCGFYRQVLPTIHCRDILRPHSIDLTMGTRISPDYDCYVFSRIPDPRMTMAIFKLFDRGKKIIWDIDDDLVNIPEWNRNKKIFDQNMLSFLEVYFKLADRVTISTDYLRAALCTDFPQSDLPSKSVVLENLIDPSYYALAAGQRSSNPRPTRILWTGSPTHSGDLEQIEPLIRHFGDRKDISFVFYGYAPEQYAAFPNDRVVHIPWGSKKHYEAIISMIQPDIGLIPLADIHFNKSKSAIKYYEMTMAGAACVLTDINPYTMIIDHGGNGFRVSDPGGWVEYCGRLLGDAEARLDMATAACDLVMSEYSWQGDSRRKLAWIEFYRSLAG